MKVALVYDRVNKWGGAERVLLALRELFPDAHLYTSVFNKRTAAWASVFSIKTSFLQSFPYANSSHEYFATFMPLAFEQFTFDAYDLVISVTSEAAKGIITKPHTKHICYCLTPTRYLWSGYEQYFANPFLKFIASPAVSYLRKWDLVAAQRPDIMVSISEEVQRRVLLYYGRESLVIYPPVVDFKSLKSGKLKKSFRNYFLVVSRLVPYKRIDLAVHACNELQLPLVIVGSGSELEKLKREAGKTIQFVGNLTDQELAEYYENCTALLFPGEEDFGLTILEAQSFGKPVIAYGKGGALETVLDGKTGVFFTPQDKEALKTALQHFELSKFKPDISKKQAEKFTSEVFKRSISKLIDTVV